MINRTVAFLPRIFLVGLFILAGDLDSAESSPPNFVIIMADDLGCADLGCFGSQTIQTPALDKMASEGTRFTQFYVAAPSCSPSRGAMMTGRSPHRLGIYTYIHAGTCASLRADEITFASLLKQSGYDTCFVGKWGLNANVDFKNEPTPADHGFDHWFATQNNSIPDHRDPETFVRNGKVLGKLKGYASQLVVDEAMSWLNNRADQQKPFCLVVWTHEPHLKLAHPEKFAELYQGQGLSEEKAAYNANVSHLDFQIGRLLDELNRLNYTQNTFSMFTSDNGAKNGEQNLAGDSGIYRAGKGMVYEGGVRMPTIIRWPNKLKPGTEDDTPLSTLDLLPTICEVTGAKLPTDRALDGCSFLDHLQGGALQRKTPLFYMNPFYAALREGDWKLVMSYEIATQQNSMIDYFRNRKFQGFETRGKYTPQLFDLKNDRSEKTNLVFKHPEKAQQLFEKLNAISQEIQQDMPDQPRMDFIPPKLYLQIAETHPKMEIPQKFQKTARKSPAKQ